jgi:enolase
MEARNQLEIDRALILLDGTPNKINLGANAVLSVSIAACKAAAASENVPPYEHVGHLFGLKKGQMKIPVPIMNLINGGKHGTGNLDFQEFHVIPSPARPYHEALRIGEEVYQSIKQVLIRHGAIHSVGDEGGFAPNLFTNMDAIEVFAESIKETSYTFGKDIFFGLDVAAGNFYQNGQYKIRDRTQALDPSELIEFYRDLLS